MLEEEDRASIELVERAGEWEEEEEDRASAELVERAVERDEGEGEPLEVLWFQVPRNHPAPDAPRLPTPDAPRPPTSDVHPPLIPPSGLTKKDKHNLRNKLRRKRKRESSDVKETKSDRLQASRIKKARRNLVQTNAELKAFRPGLKLPVGCEKKDYTLGELKQKGFRVLKWNGL